jgi:hypothetical protein
MNRQDWEFDYTIGEVRTACSTRATFHRSRVEYWKNKFNEVKASLPDTITIEDAEEFMAANAASSSSYGAPKLRLDRELEGKFNLATMKVMEHRKNADIYERWVAVLTREKDQRMLQLMMNDVEFFSLHDGALKKLVEEDDKE